MAYTYILRCSDGTYYTGSTIDLEKRLKEHNSGYGANFTANRLPVELNYFEEFLGVSKAFDREKQIQRWSRRKKEALVSGRKKELSKLAHKRWYRRRS